MEARSGPLGHCHSLKQQFRRLPPFHRRRRRRRQEQETLFCWQGWQAKCEDFYLCLRNATSSAPTAWSFGGCCSSRLDLSGTLHRPQNGEAVLRSGLTIDGGGLKAEATAPTNKPRLRQTRRFFEPSLLCEKKKLKWSSSEAAASAADAARFGRFSFYGSRLGSALVKWALHDCKTHRLARNPIRFGFMNAKFGSRAVPNLHFWLALIP